LLYKDKIIDTEVRHGQEESREEEAGQEIQVLLLLLIPCAVKLTFLDSLFNPLFQNYRGALE
jgi:hypothetical protein